MTAKAPRPPGPLARIATVAERGIALLERVQLKFEAQDLARKDEELARNREAKPTHAWDSPGSRAELGRWDLRSPQFAGVTPFLLEQWTPAYIDRKHSRLTVDMEPRREARLDVVDIRGAGRVLSSYDLGELDWPVEIDFADWPAGADLRFSAWGGKDYFLRFRWQESQPKTPDGVPLVGGR